MSGRRLAVSRRLAVGWRPGGLHRLPTPAGAVRYRVVRADPPAVGAAPALVVGLHGFGSDERQVASMLALDLPGPLVYLAPQAPEPEGSGFSWFGLQAGPGGRPEPEPAALAGARARLHAFAAAAARAWRTDPARAALVGYSQGGALALDAALRDPGPFAAIAALAGGAAEGTPGPPRVPLFVGAGTLDPVAPADAVRRRAASWPGVALSVARGAHVVTAQHRADLSAWLRPRLAP